MPPATADAIRAWIYRKEKAPLTALSALEANLPGKDGFTPLMNAVLATPPEPAIVKILLDRGADVNQEERGRRWTALHFAARDCGTDIVEALLDAGASVDPVNSFGNTPLFEVVMSPKSDRRLLVARLLAGRGADVDKKNEQGGSPLDLARRINDAEMLAVLTRQPGPCGTWERLLEGKTDADFTPYAVSRRYARGQLVEHAKFGKGVVVEVGPTTAEILFRAGVKKLGHGL